MDNAASIREADKAEAIAEATKIAISDGIEMVVTESEYAEYEEDRFSYYPASAAAIFAATETIVETIPAGGK